MPGYEVQEFNGVVTIYRVAKGEDGCTFREAKKWALEEIDTLYEDAKADINAMVAPDAEALDA